MPRPRTCLATVSASSRSIQGSWISMRTASFSTSIAPVIVCHIADTLKLRRSWSQLQSSVLIRPASSGRRWLIPLSSRRFASWRPSLCGIDTTRGCDIGGFSRLGGDASGQTPELPLCRLVRAGIALNLPRLCRRRSGVMLSRRELGGGLAAAAAVRRRGSAPPATPPEPAKEPNLARILRTRRLRVGGPLDQEPYFYKNSATGHWSGSFVAMAGDLAAALRVELAGARRNCAHMAAHLRSGEIELAFRPSPASPPP